MAKKKYKLRADQIKQLIPDMRGCIATDSITVDGELVQRMVKETPHSNIDTGWRFFSELEAPDYLDDPDNSDIFAVNTIANFDRAIIPYLSLPVGSELERIEGTEKFRMIPG
jgi:hypothetical protein